MISQTKERMRMTFIVQFFATVSAGSADIAVTNCIPAHRRFVEAPLAWIYSIEFNGKRVTLTLLSFSSPMGYYLEYYLNQELHRQGLDLPVLTPTIGERSNSM